MYKLEAVLEECDLQCVAHSADSDSGEPVLSEVQLAMAARVEVLIRQSVDGDAARHLAARRGRGLYTILVSLRNWSGVGVCSLVDESAVDSEFSTKRFDPRQGSLSEWISRKFSLALAMPQSCPSGPVLERRMRTVLLNLLPASFDEVAAQLRVSPAGSWQTLERALLDFDAARSQSKKNEVAGVFHVDGEDGKSQLRALLAEVLEERFCGDGAVEAYYSSGKGGKRGSPYGGNSAGPTCWNCGKSGHKADACWSQKWVGKGGKDGKGKKKGEKPKGAPVSS